MPNKAPSRQNAVTPQTTRQVTPKQALAAAIEELGPEATSRDLTRFMKKRFALKIQFMFIEPIKAVHGRAKMKNPLRRMAG